MLLWEILKSHFWLFQSILFPQFVYFFSVVLNCLLSVNSYGAVTNYKNSKSSCVIFTPHDFPCTVILWFEPLISKIALHQLPYRLKFRRLKVTKFLKNCRSETKYIYTILPGFYDSCSDGDYHLSWNDSACKTWTNNNVLKYWFYYYYWNKK